MVFNHSNTQRFLPFFLIIQLTKKISFFVLIVEYDFTKLTKTMKPEQQQDHARLEKLILVAALTCCAAMVYLLSLSILS